MYPSNQKPILISLIYLSGPARESSAPAICALLMVAALIISCFQRDKTYFGRYNYSIGGNEGLLV